MECLGHVLAVQPVADIMNSLETIVAPHVVFLTELAGIQVQRLICVVPLAKQHAIKLN